MARILRIAAVLLGWIPAGLILGLLWLDAGEYEGYRPEMSELTIAATGAAAVAALVLGFMCGSRAPTSPARVLAVLSAGAVLAVAELSANDALYRYVIPLGEEPGQWGTPHVVWPVCAAAAGLGLGLLRRRSAEHDLAGSLPRAADSRPAPGSLPWAADARPVPGSPPAVADARPALWIADTEESNSRAGRPVPKARRRLIVAGAVALAGFLAVPQFVRIGAELATVSFVPAGAVPIGSGQRITVPLAAGRHALFAFYGSEGCELTDATGRRLSLTRPAIALTDNSDSIVTELSGWFEVRQPGPITVACTGAPGDAYQVADLPRIDGPLASLVYASAALTYGIGLLPGALLAAWALISTRRRRADPDRLQSASGLT
ncbi:MAG: hypothetical protein ABW000_21915 [Actinoplanes sp.]